LGLTPDLLVHAVAIGASHAGGTTEFTCSGGDVKRLHGGNGASFGVRAGFLTEAGFAGPRAPLTGKRGFLHAFSPAPEPCRLVESLGTDWQLSHVMTKPYACNARLTPQIDALTKLIAEYNLRPSDIHRIRVGTDDAAVSHGLADPGSAGLSVSATQMSTPVAMALRIVRGANDFDAYFQLTLGDGIDAVAVADLAKRVETYVDDDCNSARPTRRIAKVIVATIDGRLLRAEAASPEPTDLREQDVVEKFHRLAADHLDEAAVQQVIEIVGDLEVLDDIRTLTNLLSRTRRTDPERILNPWQTSSLTS
jgi:2-methylcitrate dehydratase PrpD